MWTVCLLFFEIALLLGYLYAHLLIRNFRPRIQGWIHTALLAASLLTLPILPKRSWQPSGLENPAFYILMILGVVVGLPYFLLSSTSPLLQAWYAQSRAGSSPYRFYALSNAGSMLALVSYPILVEPMVSSRHQALGWSIAYAVVAVLCALVAFSGRADRAVERPSSQAPPEPGRKIQLLWVALAACGSALLLAVTNHVSQNIAAVPFLWIVPLSLYLLSFILCFERAAWYNRSIFLRLLGVALGGMAYALAPRFSNLPFAVMISLFCAGLFICCMFCHGELARLKPHPDHLTSFYLLVSLGGAMGAVFVALLAPYLFAGYYELEVALGLCTILALITLFRDPAGIFYKERRQPAVLILVILAAALVAGLYLDVRNQAASAQLRVRNFYGVLRVVDSVGPGIVLEEGEAAKRLDDDLRYHKLMNGTIDHGLQFVSPLRRDQPTSYYGRTSGIGLALQGAAERGPLRVGVIGLGTGTLAAYGRAGDRYTFYEINPWVVKLAYTEFSFLRDSKAKIDVIPGDARLSLERQPPQDFDVLVVDAFSGDSIPVHLLTRQAFSLYLRHLKPDGIVAVHISNKYLNLLPVVDGAAQWLHKEAMIIQNQPDNRQGVYRARWVLIGNHPGFLNQPTIKTAGLLLTPKDDQQLWTDDYSSVFRLLK